MFDKVHAGVAQEEASKGIVRLVVEITRRRHLHDFAILHQRELVRQRHHLGLVVGGVDDRLAHQRCAINEAFQR